jgi:hypothetical protein
MKRSITLASVEVPWLHAAVAESGREGHGGLSMLGVMEHQEPEAITEAFIVLLSTFVDLLNRLIGDGLVDRLLAEVWPTVFAYVVKDPRE